MSNMLWSVGEFFPFGKRQGKIYIKVFLKNIREKFLFEFSGPQQIRIGFLKPASYPKSNMTNMMEESHKRG
jgi:hypothetical protein